MTNLNHIKFRSALSQLIAEQMREDSYLSTAGIRRLARESLKDEIESCIERLSDPGIDEAIRSIMRSGNFKPDIPHESQDLLPIDLSDATIRHCVSVQSNGVNIWKPGPDLTINEMNAQGEKHSIAQAAQGVKVRQYETASQTLIAMLGNPDLDTPISKLLSDHQELQDVSDKK